MNGSKLKRVLIILVFTAVLIVGLLFIFFFRMGTNDARALTGFQADYHSYDRAISEYYQALSTSNSEGAFTLDELDHTTEETLASLKTKASVRISSLTRHDGEIMNLWIAIANLAGKELETLKAYRSAIISDNPNAAQLLEEFNELVLDRHSAYDQYLALSR